jgi:hypothetical protein
MGTIDVNSEISCRLDDLARRLDRLEAALPLIPARALGLTRASARRMGVTASEVASDVGRHLERLGTTATTALSTSVGQTRSAVVRTSSTARRTTKEAIGQTRAQAERTGRVAEASAGALLADATSAIEPEGGATPASLDNLTKTQLYERAQDLDIEGRSSMSKSELVRAIRSA